MTKVEWDYSERAAFYDKRADYSENAIVEALGRMSLVPGTTVADIGAGTGKLARPLALHGLRVNAVEPNDEMRRFGIKNTEGLPVKWSDGTGERTGLPPAAFQAAFFGSSFNVVDQLRALAECARILQPNGWFCCMWNHRDLDDPIQSRIESIIKRHIPGYDYGKRREDPTEVIRASGLFSEIRHVEAPFQVQMSREDVVEAWKSHATLARQSAGSFTKIIDEINRLLSDTRIIDVPYTTRIWFSQRAAKKIA